MARPVKHYGGYRIRWLDENGNRRSETYKTCKEAEAALRLREGAAEEIKRGLRLPTPTTKTFDELCNYYLAIYSSQKRRRHDDESIIRAHLRPFFGTMMLNAVADRVEEYKISRAHLHAATVHGHLTLLISMLRVAHEKNWLASQPRIKKPRIRLFNKDFRYLRTQDEITRFLCAAQEEGELEYALYATAIYTGMRAGELAGLQWDDIDFAHRLITVQRSYDGPTKSGDIRHVPILDPLLPILRAWRLKHPGTHVFTNQAGGTLGESARVFQEILQRVLDHARFPKIERNGKPRHFIVFHDLRHTFASHWMTKGGDLFKLQHILGHKSAQMTQRYAHLAPHAFSSDYSRLGVSAPAMAGTVIPLLKQQ